MFLFFCICACQYLTSSPWWNRRKLFCRSLKRDLWTFSPPINLICTLITTTQGKWTTSFNISCSIGLSWLLINCTIVVILSNHNYFEISAIIVQFKFQLHFVNEVNNKVQNKENKSTVIKYTKLVEGLPLYEMKACLFNQTAL